MGEKIVVGPKFGGLVNAIQPFAIDNDSFPFLLNAYEWRGKIKRKRGTSLLGRLQRYFNSTSSLYIPRNTSTIIRPNPPYFITLDGISSGNLFMGPYASVGPPIESFALPSGNVVAGTITLTDTVSGNIYTDPLKNGTLNGFPAGSGTINYASGVFTILGGSGHTIEAIFVYNPSFPVEGLRQLNLNSTQFPQEIAFDTTYSYQISTASPNNIYDVSFYKNPPSTTINTHTYTAKTNATPTSWNGQDYRQFWSLNYQNAFWATNGINVPFSTTNIGMQFQIPVTSTRTDATTMTFTISNCPLVQGDWVFVNEFLTGGIPAISLNFQTGFVRDPVTTVLGVSTVVVTFPYANIANVAYTGGIIQYLTNRSDPTIDCLRWYDGDPTNANPTNPVVSNHLGWVNFAPPLSNLVYSIAGFPQAQYYLVGARMIVPFKDRILFFGPVIQSSSAGSQKYLQDTIIYSQNGTAFYTCSFDGSTDINPQTLFNQLLTPGLSAESIETATANAYWEDQTGLGGFLSAGFEQPITTVSPNEDVLIVGFSTRQARLIYSSNEDLPFNFYVINSELGSGSTFSTINLDRGVMTVGDHGFVLTSQIGAQRFDLQIPDALFQFNLLNNATQRITAQRDFINEWVYFTYCSNENNYTQGIQNKFPNQTLQYNYREETWAVFNENYTAYGQFRPSTGLTWATVGQRFPTWNVWNEPWNSGSSTVLQPQVIAGNAQGFVLIRDQGTGEGNSIYITNISFPAIITGAINANPCVLTANNSFVVGQTIMIMGVAGMTELNGNFFTITSVTPTTITINFDSTAAGLYTSGGTTVPQTIYSPNHGLNDGDYITINGALGTIATGVNGKIFSVFNATDQGFMINVTPAPGTYLGNGFIQRMYVPLIQTKQFNPAWGLTRKTRIGVQQYLFTKTNNGQITVLIYLSQNPIGIGSYGYNSGRIIPQSGSLNNALIYSSTLFTCPESTNLGLTPANINLQMVTANNQEQIWHRINTSLIGDTVQLGFTLTDAQMRDRNFSNQFTEIELHSFTIDVNPSQYLS